LFFRGFFSPPPFKEFFCCFLLVIIVATAAVSCSVEEEFVKEARHQIISQFGFCKPPPVYRSQLVQFVLPVVLVPVNLQEKLSGEEREQFHAYYMSYHYKLS
jgi:heme/copper-type cytochrome/quinol oxidase subunit 4